MDYAAATPVSRSVYKVLQQFLQEDFYNPSALYHQAYTTRQLIERGRETVAKLLDARSHQIIFTSGGTEGNNIAIQGAIRKWKERFPHELPRIIISAIEHSSVRDICLWYQAQNQAEIIVIDVDTDGIIDTDMLKKSINENTVLISVGYVQSEIGVVQPLRDIAKIIRHYKKHHTTRHASYPLFHTDAVAAMWSQELSVNQLHVDAMTFSGSKIYGPKGSGCVYLRSLEDFAPLSFGGGQEFDMRPGTEFVGGIMGFVQACTDIRMDYERACEKLYTHQQLFFHELDALQKRLEERYGSGEYLRIHGSRTMRIPHNVACGIKGISSEQLIFEFDARGVCVASRSACSQRDKENSYVLDALYGVGTSTDGTIRFSFGHQTTIQDIHKTIRILEVIIDHIYQAQMRFLKK